MMVIFRTTESDVTDVIENLKCQCGMLPWLAFSIWWKILGILWSGHKIPRVATPSSLVSLKSRMILPFWFRLTQVVLGCSSCGMATCQVRLVCVYSCCQCGRHPAGDMVFVEEAENRTTWNSATCWRHHQSVTVFAVFNADRLWRLNFLLSVINMQILQCFDAVGWVAGRASGL